MRDHRYASIPPVEQLQLFTAERVDVRQVEGGIFCRGPPEIGLRGFVAPHLGNAMR